MLRRAVRLLSSALIAALLYSSHCYTTCGAVILASSASSSCPHHSENSHSSGTACPYQHSDFFSPAAAMDVAGLANVHFRSMIEFPSVMWAVQIFNTQPFFEVFQRAALHALPGSSVFALLSIFRI